MSAAPKLRHCPFCGEAPRTFTTLGLVSCLTKECPARSNMVTPDKWNRRAGQQAAGLDADIKRAIAQAQHYANYDYGTYNLDFDIDDFLRMAKAVKALAAARQA